MLYSIHHTTKFHYTGPISESVMEVRMQPRTEALQRCLSFELALRPRARVFAYRDYQGNNIHHFDIPAPHSQLVITADALVEVLPPPELPEALRPDSWAELDALAAEGDYWDILEASALTQPSDLLTSLAHDLKVARRADPLSLLREINTAIHDLFDYDQHSTRVDSPIDDALRLRSGVCQDFAHIMIALVRMLKVPCRYVSGYLFHRVEDHDRSAQDASHAWVEALLPGLGWVGFDPTNNLVAGERHIRVAVGCDYSDVPPTRGIYKGPREHELSVAVRVSLADQKTGEEEVLPLNHWLALQESEREEQQMQQQQQQ